MTEKSNTYARKENIFKYMYDSTSCVILTETEEASVRKDLV